MRRIDVLTMVSLDGVMQAPGGPDEDISGGFNFGGWTVPYVDESLGNTINEELSVLEAFVDSICPLAHGG